MATEVIYRHLYLHKGLLYASESGLAVLATEFYKAMKKPECNRDPDDVEDIENDFDYLARKWNYSGTKEELFQVMDNIITQEGGLVNEDD